MAPSMTTSLLTAGLLVLGTSAQATPTQDAPFEVTSTQVHTRFVVAAEASTTPTQMPSTFLVVVKPSATSSRTGSDRMAHLLHNNFHRNNTGPRHHNHTGHDSSVLRFLDHLRNLDLPHNHTGHKHTGHKHNGHKHATLTATPCTKLVMPTFGAAEQTSTMHLSTVYEQAHCSEGVKPTNECVTETLRMGHGPVVRYVETKTVEHTTVTLPCGELPASTWTEAASPGFVTVTDAAEATPTSGFDGSGFLDGMGGVFGGVAAILP